jgi:hypothetical protein
MILEGIVTTISADGLVNVAPMGPTVDDDPSRVSTLILRPFASSRTFQNLRAVGEGVFHVTDDMLLLARATIGELDVDTVPSAMVRPPRLADCCRYFEFRIQEFDQSQERGWIVANIVAHGRVRDFFGFNRAKFAVLEAAILASRVGILSAKEIHEQLDRLKPLVEKTGGSEEKTAWDLLRQYVESRAGQG